MNLTKRNTTWGWGQVVHVGNSPPLPEDTEHTHATFYLWSKRTSQWVKYVSILFLLTTRAMGVAGSPFSQRQIHSHTHNWKYLGSTCCARWTPEERVNAMRDRNWNPKPSFSVVNVDSLVDDFMICSNEVQCF